MEFCELPLTGSMCDAADAIDFVSDPGAAITEGIGNWIAKSTGQLAAAAADLAARAVDSTTAIDLNAGWFRDNYQLILPIGLVMLVGTFCAQLVRAAVRRDGRALAQAFTGTVVGVFFAFSAIALTTVAIEVIDALSAGLFKAANTSVDDAVRRLVAVGQLGALTGLGWLVPTVAGLGSALGALLYWAVMVVRKVGILVLVTLAVFAGAGGGWEVARRWRRGWIEATATLVVSKLLMTIVFLLGVSAMGRTEKGEGIAALSDVMAGIVVMALVLLCPYATFKFVHWAAEGSSGEELHRAGGAGTAVAARHAQDGARKAATWGTTGGAAAAAPQGPSTVPGQGGIAPVSASGGDSAAKGGGVPTPSNSPAASGTWTVQRLAAQHDPSASRDDVRSGQGRPPAGS